GDESGYTLTDNQKMKLAALEAMWETEKAPAGLNIFGIPDVEERTTHNAIKIPYVLGLIATRSLDGTVEGILPLVAVAEERIENGVVAYDAVQKLREDPNDISARETFEASKRDLGYGLLLKRYVADPRQATKEQIQKAAWDTVPNVPVLFWVFRIMVGIGFYFIALFAGSFYFASVQQSAPRWLLRLAVISIPLPWIAAEVGWLLAEHGRQPWIIEGVLPTFLGVSSLNAGQVMGTIIGFTALYGVLAIIEITLMLRAIGIGPYGHKTAKPAGGAAAAMIDR
ncbi:MAG TPA: cytochrome ubiquinol oxidase subunit I, partial [Parvularculaceae bacterium]|nr:cytochrome ubiquinol oxidase subunit I [Parvularculaceae bacterium]